MGTIDWSFWIAAAIALIASIGWLDSCLLNRDYKQEIERQETKVIKYGSELNKIDELIHGIGVVGSGTVHTVNTLCSLFKANKDLLVNKTNLVKWHESALKDLREKLLAKAESMGFHENKENPPACIVILDWILAELLNEAEHKKVLEQHIGTRDGIILEYTSKIERLDNDLNRLQELHQLTVDQSSNNSSKNILLISKLENVLAAVLDRGIILTDFAEKVVAEAKSNKVKLKSITALKKILSTEYAKDVVVPLESIQRDPLKSLHEKYFDANGNEI